MCISHDIEDEPIFRASSNDPFLVKCGEKDRALRACDVFGIVCTGAVNNRVVLYLNLTMRRRSFHEK